MGRIVSPKKEMPKSQHPILKNKTLFGNRVFTEVIELKGGNYGEP